MTEVRLHTIFYGILAMPVYTQPSAVTEGRHLKNFCFSLKLTSISVSFHNHASLHIHSFAREYYLNETGPLAAELAGRERERENAIGGRVQELTCSSLAEGLAATGTVLASSGVSPVA